MPQTSSLQTDPLLQRFVIAYALNRDGLVAGRLAPEIEGVPTSGTYYKRHKRSHFRTFDIRRAKGDQYKEIDYELGKDTYATEDKGLRAPIDIKEKRDAEQAGRLIDLRSSKARVVTDAVLVSIEKEVADELRDTSVLTQNVTLTAGAGTRWDDYDNSDPVDTVDTGIQTIRAATGKRPNILSIPFDVFMSLRRHPVMLARDGRTDVRDLGEADLAKIFSVDEVVVADAIYDSAEETLSDAMTGADIWGKDAILAYVEPDPDMEAASLAYQFVHQGLTPNNYMDPSGKTEWAEVGTDRVFKLVDASCGYLMKTVIS